MSKKWITLTLALIAGVAGAAQAATGFKLLGAQGARYFVAVNAAQAADSAALKDVAAGVCKPAKPCVVLFWSDEGAAGSKMPLSATQRKALVAQYTRNPTTGNEQLLLKCRGDEAAGTRCLK